MAQRGQQAFSRSREKEGPAAKRREDEGLLTSYTAYTAALARKKKEDPHPTLSRVRERAI